MAEAATMADSMSLGHDGYTPHMPLQGENKFTLGGVAVLTTGSVFQPHTHPQNAPHPSNVMGSSKIYIGGNQLAIIGDSLDCGGAIDTGSPRLTVGV